MMDLSKTGNAAPTSMQRRALESVHAQGTPYAPVDQGVKYSNVQAAWRVCRRRGWVIYDEGASRWEITPAGETALRMA